MPPQPDVHLSDLAPLRAVGPGHTYGDCVRFAAHSNPPQKDESNEGHPLQLHGVKYAKGMGVHAMNQMIFQLKPEYERFVALAGVDEHILAVSNGSNLAMHPSVVFKVFIDGKEAAASPVMRIAIEPWRFDVQIPPGSKIISLATMDAGNGNQEDRANWVHCGFVRVGQYYAGEGDIDYLQLLDIARRMFAPDPEFQNMAMLYDPDWNGLVEGPTWKAWWIAEQLRPDLLCAAVLPGAFRHLLAELTGPLVRPDGRRQNARAIWTGSHRTAACATAPLPDCSSANRATGGWTSMIGPWNSPRAGMLHAGGTAADRPRSQGHRALPAQAASGAPISSKAAAIRRTISSLPDRRAICSAPAMPAGKNPTARYDKAYLAGLSITYIAALDRLIELEKMAGDAGKAELYTERRDLARKGLPQLTTEEGYFIKSLDPDGTKHGVYGAAKHGYFEAVCNHDAICFRVADDAQAEKIYARSRRSPACVRTI